MQEKQEKIGLVWFRNNLRVKDNISLTKAITNNDKVIAVYFFDPKYFKEDSFGFLKTGKFRAKFLLESINNLKENLAHNNITLLTFFKSPESEINTLCSQFNIDTIYTQKEWTLEEVTTNKAVKRLLDKSVVFVEDYDQFLFHPDTVSKNFSNIPNVFTVFRKKLEKYVKIQEEYHATQMPKENLVTNVSETITLQDLGFTNFKVPEKTAFPFSGGESSALARLENYFFESKKVSHYKKTRNGLVGVDYSTKFSPWLANGSISAKTIYWKLKAYEKENGSNQSTYWVFFELVWRDYFKYISLKYGDKIFKIGGILDRDYTWKNNQNHIEDWINGTTKDDFVNANMIELKETGWMSNRGRQNVASYFAKELLLDWRIGAAYFESQLLDYDVHSNYGNWMYVAGVGNDPRDRKFNTQTQAERYDSNHRFRNLWLEKTLF
jgi:deoxyribodipyrimidine photo-lyase